MNHIAAVITDDSAKTQALLAAAVAEWGAAARIVGVFAESHGIPGRACGAGFLRDIVSGKAYSIYLETPSAHTSCHLDAAGVEAACAAVLGRIPTSDLVVLSKFGKLEAARSGLFRAFERAVGTGRPLLTTVSHRHRDAWQAFAPEATPLPDDGAALRRWWRSLNEP
jgi:hypothetical protein